jgi:hypothetical protein
VSDIARTAAHARAHPEEAEERLSRLSMVRAIARVLNENAPAWAVEQVGKGNLIRLVTCGREYRVVVMGGEKL